MNKLRTAKKYKTICFKSKDGLLITADLYSVQNPKGLILLCHRSHCNRSEYRETAPKLNLLGYTCLAIDQRSEMNIFGEINETSTLAKQKGIATGYLDARQDIEAAIDYAFNINKKRPILLLGSSYSASLALLIAKFPQKLNAIILFSPGEFLKGTMISEEIQSLNIPIFATCAKKEIKEMVNLFKYGQKKLITLYRPKVQGFHGSKALWDSVNGSLFYWTALSKFLLKVNS